MLQDASKMLAAVAAAAGELIVDPLWDLTTGSAPVNVF